MVSVQPVRCLWVPGLFPYLYTKLAEFMYFPQIVWNEIHHRLSIDGQQLCRAEFSLQQFSVESMEPILFGRAL
jgi:hypothetical protein